MFRKAGLKGSSLPSGEFTKHPNFGGTAFTKRFSAIAALLFCFFCFHPVPRLVQLAQGRPLVATRLGRSSHTVNNHRKMLHIVRAKAEEALAEGLRRGVRDPELGMLQDNLTKQLMKLHNLDYFSSSSSFSSFFIIISLFVAYCF